ncbi:hypothetical protein QE152_g6844 [Popillia japonica]|uniref:Uncharacterized protein n=1 Tax=Popillia japonica TaxID=7064 RepID=A0AAW1MGP1_POPJA
MNLITSPTRTRLTIEHISALMFIKLNGPNIRTWKPEYYVRTWLRRHRTADDTRTRRGTIEHISALMFIKLNGPNIRTWKPKYYVRTWLRRHRTADDTRTRRGKHQPSKEEEDAFADYL